MLKLLKKRFTMFHTSSSTPRRAAQLLLATSALAWGIAQAQTAPYPVVTTPGVTATPVAAPQPAGEAGRVIQTIPVLQQVPVPRQMCTDEQVAIPGQKSGAGAAMGAIAGGAIGNQIGGGSGRAAATALGVIGGVILGDRIEGETPTAVQTQRRCTTQTVYETRPVAYNVTYEYNGKQYTVQMQQDPGPWVQLQVMPVVPNQAPGYNGYPSPRSDAQPYMDGQGAPVVAYQPATITQETTYVVPATGYYATPPTAWYGGVRPSVWVDLSVGNRWGYRGGHHGHWR